MFDRILVLGAGGQVGSELMRSLAPLARVIEGWDRRRCALDDVQAALDQVAAFGADVIVNAAAYTAVDRAETDQDAAFRLNAEWPGRLAELAAATGALFVHYSTDYVYDGRQSSPYVESDEPAPQSVYGASKAQGDARVARAGGRHLILRTSWVYGARGGNFLKTMMKVLREREGVRVVGDQFGSPTGADLIADVTALVLRQIGSDPSASPWGVYHLTASGTCSWFDYAHYVAGLCETAGVPLATTRASLQRITAQEYPLPAVRPANSHLDTTKLQTTFDLHLPAWQAGVARTFTLLTQNT